MKINEFSTDLCRVLKVFPTSLTCVRVLFLLQTLIPAAWKQRAVTWARELHTRSFINSLSHHMCYCVVHVPPHSWHSSSKSCYPTIRLFGTYKTCRSACQAGRGMLIYMHYGEKTWSVLCRHSNVSDFNKVVTNLLSCLLSCKQRRKDDFLYSWWLPNQVLIAVRSLVIITQTDWVMSQHHRCSKLEWLSKNSVPLPHWITFIFLTELNIELFSDLLSTINVLTNHKVILQSMIQKLLHHI